MYNIKTATTQDQKAWLTLRKQLWPDCADQKHVAEMKDYLSSSEKVSLLAFQQNGDVAGFCECALRHDYVEGAAKSPTAYLEGIFVQTPFRKLGIAKELIAHAQRWAKQHGCDEIGSDTEIFNQASIDMHSRLGFIETRRIVHFIKII